MHNKQKTRYSLSYLVSQAFKSLFRNGMMTVASVAVLMSCLTVMGSFALLVYNINYNLEDLSLNEMVVYCDTEADDDLVEEIGRRIRLQNNVVEESVELIPKETVLEEERETYREYTDLFDMMGGDSNPYPDTYVFEYKDNNKVSSLQMELEQMEGVDKVNCRADLAKTIDSIKNGIIFIFMWFLVILFVVSVFVIINTIKLAVHSRRQEIYVMRYVGATKWFITTPFVLEGIAIGAFSSALAYGVEYLLYNLIYNTVSKYPLIKLAEFGKDYLWLIVLGGFVIVGVVTGIIGTAISLRKHLKA
ncbi:MAG: ABC transporter permease [Clostridia bacterium]|nr:ABC transporter permease [Clostridia bacterium]